MPVVVMESPIGPLELETVSETAVCRIEFAPRAPTGRLPSGGLLGELGRQLQAYFQGRLRRFELPLAPEGTPFQLEVWRGLVEIPYGETRSYAQLAALVGRPAAVRAVGAANGRNPIPIVIPCHRVIGSDGRLVGFGGGLEMKRALLALEQGSLF